MEVRGTSVGHVLLTRSLRSAFEGQLCKDASHGSGFTGFTIKFAFSARPHEREAAEGVEQATKAIGALVSQPAAVDHLALVVGDGTSAVAEAQAFENTWGVFFKKFELFNQIVTDIASVIGVRLFASLAHCLRPG